MKFILIFLATLIVANALPMDTSQKEKLNSSFEKKSDSEVEQLDDLKAKLQSKKLDQSKVSDVHPGKSVITSQHKEILSDVNGHKHITTQDRVISNGNIVKDLSANLEETKKPHHSHLKVHVEIPKENIHDTYIANDGKLSVSHQDIKRSRPMPHYTPMDLAYYIYKTGDEESVSEIIQEMIQNKILTTDEALLFLHEIREELQAQSEDDYFKMNENSQFLMPLMEESDKRIPPPALHMQEVPRSNVNEEDYENILEKLKSSQDYESLAEFSIEDIIYQISKVLFKQSYDRDGEAGSEKALEQVNHLLNKEVDRGAIPGEMQQKVLDVVLSSLMDTMNESKARMIPTNPMLGGSKLSNDDLRIFKQHKQTSETTAKTSPLAFKQINKNTKEDKKLAEKKDVKN